MKDTSLLKRAIVHVLLVLGVLISLVPFYWMLVIASNSKADAFAYPPKMGPGSNFMANVNAVLDAIPMWSALLNTIIVAVITTVLLLFFSSLAAFAFAKFEFRGKKPLFIVLLATFMFPAQLSIVPQFVVMAKLGLVGTLQSLIIPGMVTAFGIFLLRQYADGAIPADLLDAARIDGCGFLRQWWNVAIPLLRPALAFLGIFTFVNVWNDYFWPLVVLINPDQVTVQVALSNLEQVQGATDYSMVMAGAVLAVVPLIVVFLIGARQFLSDLAAGALKQ